MKKPFVLIISLFLISVNAKSEKYYGYASYLMYPQTPTYLARGNSYSLPLNTPSSIFYNPAGLADIDKAVIELSYNLIPKIFDQELWNAAIAFPIRAINLTLASGFIYHQVSDLLQYTENMEYVDKFNVNDIAVFVGCGYKTIAYSLGATVYYSNSGNTISEKNTSDSYNQSLKMIGARFGMSYFVIKNLKINLSFFGSTKTEHQSYDNSSNISEYTNKLVSAGLTYFTKNLFNTDLRFQTNMDIEQQQFHPRYLNFGLMVAYYFRQYQGLELAFGINHFQIDNSKLYQEFGKYALRYTPGLSLSVMKNLKINYAILIEYMGYSQLFSVNLSY